MSQPTEIHTLAGAYALDALSEFERAAFARHITECSACDFEVAELRETASRLGAMAWEAPPARMRDSVLAEISRTRQVPMGPAPVEPREVKAVQRWRRVTAAAVAAGVVAVGGVATVWVVQEQRVGDARQQADQLRQEQARIAGVLASGDVRVRSTAATGGGTVTVALSPSLNDGVVMLNGVPAPPAGKTYQLWLITGQNPASAGVMEPGQGAALLNSVGTADTLGLTLEPLGGSSRPTLPILAGVPLV
jgi:anti-sigma-K factor RskA